MKIPDELVKGMNVNNLLIRDSRESIRAEGKQQIIERYTKDVMKRLYGEDCHVFFCSFKGTIFEENMAFFRGQKYPPLNESDKKVWELDKKPSITFNTEHFKQDKIPTITWIVIIHEATHFEIGMKATKKEGCWEVVDEESMKGIVIENGTLVADLGRTFLKEVGLTVEDMYPN